MTQPIEFLRRDFANSKSAGVEANPIVDEDALQEAVLADVRTDLVHSSVGLLLDLRAALQFRKASLGALVLRDINEFHWDGEIRKLGTVWNVIGSEIARTGGKWQLELAFFPNARLVASCSAIDFMEGAVSEADALPPNMTEWVTDVVWKMQMSAFGVARTVDL